eukprot:TRINITY_DN28586_c0_g1_i6.p1 TRINITY_DN28586_c0_g1~~TRINITY_DN28586_c0_g1_i6.p1  ORF type:complete len:441 (+),score=49.43 TRINITY_DN28586_c0_g1_i6:443-1765(+)
MPHKRARCCESPCGAQLRARVEAAQQVDRACGGFSRKRPLASHASPARDMTLVSGLWNLRRDTWAAHVRYKEGEGRAYTRYLEWLDAGLLRKRQAVVLFLDSEAAEFARSKRREYNLTTLTCVLEIPQEELPQMRWREEYVAAHEENMRKLPNDTQPEVVRSDYTLVVNSKPELLACAALWNPFGSETFAWVDAGAGRKPGFPYGPAPILSPGCGKWSICVGRRMWMLFDFRSKLKRLEHGSTFDSTVLLGGLEGVLLYALWFQWAIARYLEEQIMDDEQSVIAEVWWTGRMTFGNFFGLSWEDTLTQMLPLIPGSYVSPSEVAAAKGVEIPPAYQGMAASLGRWFGDTPHLIWRNEGNIWVPSATDLMMVEQVPVNEVTDEGMERIIFALWCLYGRVFYYYQHFCDVYASRVPQIRAEGFENLPIVSANMEVITPSNAR